MTEQRASVLVSIIVPVYNEAANIEACLQPLQSLRSKSCEIIVVDGGSDDDSLAIAQPFADHVIESTKGRALQMNAGATLARGEYYLFVHADTTLPDLSERLGRVGELSVSWGFFPVRLSGAGFVFACISFFINWRSRLSAVATGDQCLFVRRALFEEIKGFPAIPLMEDVALSKKLKKLAKPIIFSEKVVTSSRRWRQNGVLKTILLMWSLRLAYVLRVDPLRLQKIYYGS